ncbi:MAG: FG-GAP repeat protein [Bacteroidota bacterium]
MMKHKRLKTATALLLGAGMMAGLNAQDYVQSEKITLETRDVNDQFGTAVCFEDNQLFVGSTGQKEDENGQNPLEKAGAVFVYEKQADHLAQVQMLVASDREEGDQLGNDVDVSGNYLVTGASNHAKDQAGNNELTKAGAVYVFKKNSEGKWDEVQKLVASDRAQNDLFGGSVAIEGDYLAVGAPGKDNSQGAVYVFEKNSSNVWEETKILTSMNSFYPTYGRDLDISGNRLIVGSPSQIYSTTDPVYHYNFAGMAFIYERDDDGVWQEVYSASSSDVMEKDHFATSVAISGDYALVGTPDKPTDKDGQNTLAAAGAPIKWQLVRGTKNHPR